MQVKKHPKFNLENYSKIFTQLGLVLALFVAYVAIEQKTFEKDLASTFGEISMNVPDEIEPPIIKIPEPEIPKAKPQIPDVIDIVDNSVEEPEDIIETTETGEDEWVSIDDIVTVDDPTPDIEEDVPFLLIEDVPVFPGCTGNNEALKACFNKKMQKHFIKKFNADLPNELGLSSGKKKLIMLFKIDKTGEIIDVRVKAPHPKLEQEATRIINLLPKMKPGKQRGKPVGVKYTLPMRVDVE